MTAITIAAPLFILSVAIVPALAELQRLRAERANPLRRLRVRDGPQATPGPGSYVMLAALFIVGAVLTLRSRNLRRLTD